MYLKRLIQNWKCVKPIKYYIFKLHLRFFINNQNCGQLTAIHGGLWNLGWICSSLANNIVKQFFYGNRFLWIHIFCQRYQSFHLPTDFANFESTDWYLEQLHHKGFQHNLNKINITILLDHRSSPCSCFCPHPPSPLLLLFPLPQSWNLPKQVLFTLSYNFVMESTNSELELIQLWFSNIQGAHSKSGQIWMKRCNEMCDQNYLTPLHFETNAFIF